jgi:hypothetical protein
MSDPRDTPDPNDPALAWIPPGLKPFLRMQAAPSTPKPGEDPELDAAVAAFKACDAEAGSGQSAPPPVQDLSRGMGNTSAYVAPTEVPRANVGVLGAGEGKVELAMADVVKALPEGSRTHETVEIKVLRGPDGVRSRAQPSTTIGGTERLPVLQASPWTREAGAPVAPVELPSALGPAKASEVASSARSVSGRAAGRYKGAALGGAVLVVAAVIGLRAATTTTTPGSEGSSAAAVTSSQATTALVVEPLGDESAVAPSAAPPAAAPSTSAAAGASATASAAPAAVRPVGTATKRSGPVDDPYDPAPMPAPVKTATSTTPPVPPPAVPSAVPAAPKGPATVAPPASEQPDIVFSKPKSTRTEP